MKKMKKILALLLAMAMVAGMSLTSFAADGKREETDSAEVKITGIETYKDASGNEVYPEVTLYRIAKGDYDTDFKGFIWAEGVNPVVENGTTTIDIADVAKKLVADPQQITPFSDGEDGIAGAGSIKYGTFTATVNAGAYIAVITGGGSAIYNPILLTATYGSANNDLNGGTVDTESTYNELFGSTSVTKISKPAISKEITSSATEDGGKKTASVGDVIEYKITPTMPSYPTGAANKTAYIEDTMSDGLTFNYSSLKIKIGEAEVSIDETSKELTTQTFTYGNKVIARSQQVGNGFKLYFDYSTLADTDTGTVPEMTVVYNATLNANAAAGGEGNKNDAKLVYTNNPNQGSSYTDPENPPTPDPDNPYQEATVTQDEKNTVYTYQLAFKKIGEGEADSEKLPGATFGIYSEGTKTDGQEAGSVDESTLVDTVTTSASGYAISKGLAKGTYYIKEISAPAGYSLSQKVYEIEASYEKAVTQVTTTSATYTSTKPAEDAVQVGWLKNETFYSLTEKPEGDTTDVVPAYLETKKEISKVVTENGDQGGIALLAGDGIPNTKLSSLPSTGGIGTTIFTIGGCAIMILAAALYFASRRRSAR